MSSKLKLLDRLFWINLGAAGFIAFVLLLFLFLSLGRRPQQIRAQAAINAQFQEKLISAQITSQELHHVQDLIDRNLAYSARDSLAMGASLSFLKDLTQVMDKLRINLISLDPKKVIRKKRFVETPYEMEILCNYHQLTQLINKMEQSPRLISIEAIEVENFLNHYFSDRRDAPDHCKVTLTLSTLTLVKTET